MGDPQRFDSLVILGNGYAAHLAALALSPLLPDVTLLGPETVQTTGPENLTGQYAHSHIFLPRMERELRSIEPQILDHLAALGHTFVPGSYRLRADAPIECRRMFATRWQFNAAMNQVFRQRVPNIHIPDMLRRMRTDHRCITRLILASGSEVKVTPSTLVVDAMGTRSPLMQALSKGSPNTINEAGSIAYITQFFRLKYAAQVRSLPDPLIDCPHDFGNAYMMLYPAVDGWFSVSLAINVQQKPLMKQLRNTGDFLAFCKQNPNVAAWLNNADVIGGNRIYINPRNQWNVPAFTESQTPKNYVAVGDALTTMLPTLGANCSFAATHIRILRDLVAAPTPDLHTAFAQAVHAEQFAFFQDARIPQVHAGTFLPYAQARRNRPSKRIKGFLRRIFGLDRARIQRQLMESSSL
jgi:hypothetical protein